MRFVTRRRRTRARPANPAIGNTLPRIKSADSIKSGEKSRKNQEPEGDRRGEGGGGRNTPRNQYLILYFFLPRPPRRRHPFLRFQFDSFILTFPLVLFPAGSCTPALSRFPHALIKIRLFPGEPRESFPSLKQCRGICHSQPNPRIHFESSIASHAGVCLSRR